MHRGSSGVAVGVRSESEGRRDGLAGMPAGSGGKVRMRSAGGCLIVVWDVARVVFGVR